MKTRFISILLILFTLCQITKAQNGSFSYPEFSISISPEITEICPGVPITITCNEEYNSYAWSKKQTGSIFYGQSVDISELGSYILNIEGELGGVLYSDFYEFEVTLKDLDGDGICDDEDCNKYNQYIGQGFPCNDDNECTRNDVYNASCECIGEIIPFCSQCNTGSSCDDNNSCTRNDFWDEKCDCKGIKLRNCHGCIEGEECDDSDPCTENDQIDENCNCKGKEIINCSDIECTVGLPCDDSNPCTVDDKMDENCNCVGLEQDVTINLEYSECDRSSLRLTPIVDFVSVEWYFNDEFILTQFSDFGLDNQGVGEYKAIFRKEQGCSMTEVLEINWENIVQEIIIEGNRQKICGEEDILLSISDSYEDITWYFQDAILPISSNQTIINQQGVYKVSATDENGCKRVGALEIQSAIDGSRITPGAPILCTGGEVILQSQESRPDQTYLWSPGGETTQSIIVTSPGVYTLEISEDGCTSTSTVEVVDEENSFEKIYTLLVDAGFGFEEVYTTSTILDQYPKNDEQRRSVSNCEIENNLNHTYTIRVVDEEESEEVDLFSYLQNSYNKICCSAESVAFVQDGFCADFQLDIESFIIRSEEENVSTFFFLRNPDPNKKSFVFSKY